MPSRFVDLTVENDVEPLITLSVTKENLIEQSTSFKKLFLDNSNSSEFAPRCCLAYNKIVLLKFASWINHPRPPKTYAPASYSPEFWVDNAVPMWFLAYEIGASGLERYALSHFIQNCALALFGPWRMIEQKARRQSSLRRFSDHWIAWNCSLAGSENNEYAGLRAAALARLVTDETRDPRIYDLEHWYSPCGRYMNPSCEHDPVYRKKELEAIQEMKQPTADWGEEFERSAKSRSLNESK